MNKILGHFNKLSDQARYGILAGVVLLILLLDILFLVLPQLGSIGDVNDQIKKLSDDTQQVLTDRQRINQLRKNLQDARLQFSSLSVKVRTVQEVPAILGTISSIANQYGVKIDQLVPEEGQQETLSSSPDSTYFALPIVMKARCGYHMFGRFLNKLESEDMFFIMKEFIIQNDEKNPNTHLFFLIIKIIVVDKR